jgi:hypothetical protein
MVDQDSIDGNGPHEGSQNNREGGQPKILAKDGLPHFSPDFPFSHLSPYEAV